MATRRIFAVLVLTLGTVDATRSPAHASVPGIIVESARTVADGVRDGVRTIGRATRAFVLGGADAAEDAWYENAERTRENARRNADRVRAEAWLVPAEREPEAEQGFEPEREDVPLEPDDSYRDY